MSLHRLIPIVLALGACTIDDRPSPPAPAAAPVLAHRTQADLARELDDAERAGTWSEVRRRWQGQHVRWTVTRHRALCGSEARCNVAAFPIQRPAAQGWMPQLGFAPGEFDALLRSCGEREPCELSVEGTLAELDVSGEHATKLRFRDVRIGGGA